jgi:hypothetical protein
MLQPEERATARQWHAKNASISMDAHTITHELLKVALSTWSVKRLYNKDK